VRTFGVLCDGVEVAGGVGSRTAGARAGAVSAGRVLPLTLHGLLDVISTGISDWGRGRATWWQALKGREWRRVDHSTDCTTITTGIETILQHR
jgi:hypothetical protein